MIDAVLFTAGDPQLDFERHANFTHTLKVTLADFDILTNWLQMIAQVFYFFNPLIWYANRQIRLGKKTSQKSVPKKGLIFS